MNAQKHSLTLAAIAGAFSIALATTAVLASPTGYHLVGLPSDAPAGAISGVGGLSYSGIAVGIVDRDFYRSSFTFSSETGLADLPHPIPNERPYMTARGISGDANTVVGYFQSSATQYRPKAFRYTPGSTTFEVLRDIDHTPPSSYALHASHDGETIVGGSADGPAFWRDGNVYPLPEFRGFNSGGGAFKVDATGTTAVGVSSWGISAQDHPAAVKWSLETQTITRLAPMTNEPIEKSWATSISGDGRIIVGAAEVYDSFSQAVRWDEHGVIHTLGNLSGAPSGFAMDVSNDGRVIIGYSNFSISRRAFVWTEDSGIMLLDDYLMSVGISLPDGWYSEYGNAVSGDGRTFAGRARGPNNQAQGFVVTIPNAGTLLMLGASCLLVSRRRTR